MQTIWDFTLNVKKGKSVPLQAWSGPEGSRKLRFPDFMTTAQDGGKVVSLTAAQWLRRCETNRKVAGSIPNRVTGIFY